MASSLVSTASLFLLAASTVKAAKCPIQFEGRIPTNFTPADFDTSASPFNNSFVFGQGPKPSDLVSIPEGLSSMLDGTSSKAFEVNIDDRSVFAPTKTNVQTGFRCAEMLP